MQSSGQYGRNVCSIILDRFNIKVVLIKMFYLFRYPVSTLETGSAVSMR